MMILNMKGVVEAVLLMKMGVEDLKSTVDVKGLKAVVVTRIERTLSVVVEERTCLL
jgi:hypothetical protein